MSSKGVEKSTETPKKGNRISEEETVKFLILCIKYSDNGKINWEAVAEESGIASKGAAAKRYERLLKREGVSLPSTKATAKKRSAADINDDDDDDDGISAASPLSGGKKTAGKKKGPANPIPKKRKLAANASKDIEDADTPTKKVQNVASAGKELAKLEFKGEADTEELEVKEEIGAGDDSLSSEEA